MTCGYLVETAREAGLQALLLPIEQLGLHGGYGFVDARGDPVRVAFKLYPWEWMVHERFCAAALERMGDAAGQTLWLEPIWKMLWSNKGILAVLWHLFPGHPNLLPTYFCRDGDDGRVPVDVFGNGLGAGAAGLGESFVEKPLLAREGANARVVVAGEVVDQGPDQDYGEEGFVLQRYTDLGRYGTAGARPVLGVWVVDMEPAGLGIRESDSYITNNMSRFVPHVIAG
jgi:glutathionylspermidine synthase